MTLINDQRVLDIETALLDRREPGDGTRYDMIAIRVLGTVTCGRLGRITDGWLVVCGLTGRAYLFADGDHVVSWYIIEKLGITNAISARQTAKQIATLIRGTTDDDE